MDTPWREQAQWMGDVSAISLGGIYACFGDTALTGKFLWQSAMAQLPTGMFQYITQKWVGKWRNTTVDFSLWWVNALWNHYEYTGDENWIVRYYPQVIKLVYAITDYLDEFGLIGSIPYGSFVDWAKIDGLSFKQLHVKGENTFINALFYGVTDKVIKMAKIMDDKRMIIYLENIRTGLKKAFHERLYDENKHVYADANMDGKLSDLVSEHANMAAILWNLCDENETKNIIQTLFLEKKIPFTMAEPFATTFTLQALDRAGRIDLAYKIIRDRWGTWMVDRGASSVYEEWGINGTWRSGEYQGFIRTLSHAWSAGPAEFLIKNTIGLEIMEPGYKKIRLNPKDIGQDYNIIYPLPQGNLIVEFKEKQCSISLPDDVERV